jgi:hypothetical protein
LPAACPPAPAFAAWTEKLVEPLGVAAVVEIVRIDETGSPDPVIVDGENDADAPDGRGVVTLRPMAHDPLLVLSMLTANVADPPGVTLAGD